MGKTKTAKKRKTSDLTKNEEGYIREQTSSKWINNKILNDVDDDFKKLFIFYVINTPCKNVSGRGVDLTEYGWDEKILHSKLNKYLLEVAGLKKGVTFAIENIRNMRMSCETISLMENFYENRNTERIVMYDKCSNEFLSICYHVRNSFAHGQFEMYEDRDEITFVMEDFSTHDNAVSARMVLKKSTLLKWIEILQSGKFPADLVNN